MAYAITLSRHACSVWGLGYACTLQQWWLISHHALSAEEVQSVLAASGAPLAERYTHNHSMLVLEAALEKARRAHRPLIITSLGNPTHDPSQIHMDPSLLSALNMQVCTDSVSPANLTCIQSPCQIVQSICSMPGKQLYM